MNTLVNKLTTLRKTNDSPLIPKYIDILLLAIHRHNPQYYAPELAEIKAFLGRSGV